uniref:Ig-like domain-containing protein n=1 Tax=Poecilia formosa TaxID=48698 RepID=A0A087XQ27_POEFO
IFLMRDDFPDPTKQHEDYKNRVELRDPDLKDGNLSLVLRNVSSKDVGTYVCRMKTSGGRQKRATIKSQPISIIHLRVENPVRHIKVHSGRDVILPCQAAVDADVTALEWTRPDLEHNGYVCLVRDGIPDPTRQHPSYRGRVALADPQLRNGDLSLVLENATRSDTGTYECRLIRKKENKSFRKISNINLKFSEEVSVSQQEVSVRLLQDVTLACHGGVANISVLKWSRSDLSGGGYVYFYRNKRSFERYQHRHFHGRVMLWDAAMTGGDASLILRNASFLDAGTYECHLQGPGPENDQVIISYWSIIQP